jgi:hypothetical protein
MSLEQVIRQIWPGATFYLILVTFAIASFRFARELRAGEARIYEEFLERVRAIREIFQSRYIEPVIARVLDQSVEAARTETIQTVRAAFAGLGSPPLDQNAIAAALDPPLASLQRQPGPGQTFLTSRDGTAFVEQLDRRQQQRHRMLASYEALKQHTRNGYLSFFSLSVVFLLGLVRLAFPVPSYIIVTYVDVAVLILLFGTYSVGKMFRAENTLRDSFEKLTLYAEEFQ